MVCVLSNAITFQGCIFFCITFTLLCCSPLSVVCAKEIVFVSLTARFKLRAQFRFPTCFLCPIEPEMYFFLSGRETFSLSQDQCTDKRPHPLQLKLQRKKKIFHGLVTTYLRMLLFQLPEGLAVCTLAFFL